MARRGDSHGTRRPWTALTAVATAAHHGFELMNGVGLVWQPQLGLSGAGALWGAQLSMWTATALGRGKRHDRVLASWSGAALGGALVHFLLWPWKRNALGLPVLTEAEGLRPTRLPAYNAILYAWAVAAALSIRELPRGSRVWALAGFATLPVLRRSASHHFSWLQGQAATNPAWWNRGVR